MNKYIAELLTLFSIPLLTISCGHSASEIADIVSERDSLRNETKRQQKSLDKLNDVIDIVNGSLVSIAQEEGNLFIAGTSEEGGPVTKEQVLDNVARLENLISDQKQKIAELESNLSADEAEDETDPKETSQLKALIASLKQQIAAKDAQIAKLKQELSQKDVDLSKLRAQTAQQSQTIVELDRRASLQQEALKRQDAMLNHCYMVMGTKKELQNKGIIKKGRIVAQNALDRSKFSKVDIRKVTEITFSAKKPKLLTSMPESSYEITTDGNNNFTLSIKNPTAFWSVSNYLIIQTD